MNYSQSKKLTLSEKKLQTLKTQLYGKETKSLKQNLPKIMPTANKIQTITLEANFLKKDLLKTLILASVLFGIQVLLFISLKSGLVKL